MDSELERLLAPVRERPFATYHDAFPYLVKRYQLNLAGVVEEVPDVQPSPRYLSDLYRRLGQGRAKAIFTEPRSFSKLAGRIARDLDLRLGELDPLETGPLAPGSYEEGMRRNGRTLHENLR
jgi:zinc/manganese transport system substrate-binding protein